MKLTIRKQIGETSYPFTFEGNNLHECVMESKKLSFYDVRKCGNCNSDYLYLDAYVTKEEGFEYTKIVCGKCKSSITFGQVKKTPDVFYLRRKEDKSLDWQQPQNQGVTNEQPTDDTTPF